MDFDDLVMIEREAKVNATTTTVSRARHKMAKEFDTDSESEAAGDTRPIIHTNTTMRNRKFRYHNYLCSTNDNCADCHEQLLQAYRDDLFRLPPPPPPPPPMPMPVSQTRPNTFRWLNFL